jgi:hypothetical protein
MGEVIYVDFPDHFDHGRRLKLPECFSRPRFWRRVMAPLGVLGLAGGTAALAMNQEAAPAPYVCTIGTVGEFGTPVQAVQDAAKKAGLQDNPHNLVSASRVVYDLSGEGVVHQGDRFNICFSGAQVDLDSIREASPAEDPALFPSGHASPGPVNAS